MNRKVVLITIYYIIGTIGGLYFKNIIPFLLLFGIIHCFIYKKKKLIVLSIFIIAILKSYGTQCYVKGFKGIEEYNIQGDIIRVTEKEKSNIYEIKANKINGKNCLFGSKIRVYAKKKYKADVGDKVYLTGRKFEQSYTRNEGCFNYDNYLKSKEIFCIVEADKITKSKLNIKNYYLKFIELVRIKIRSAFYRYLPDKIATICVALVIGEKDTMDEDIKETFSDAGLSHIIAISGMHTVYVAYMAMIFKKVLGKRCSYKIVIVILFIFCNLAYNSDSVFRAAIMLAIFYLSKIVYRKSDSLSNLFLAIFIGLIKNPFCIYSPGFILSTAGTFGIITMYEQNNATDTKKILSYIKNQIKLGLAANLVLFPIIAKMYNKISLMFIISSPIINCLMSLLMPIVFILAILSIFSNFLPVFVMKIIAFLVTIIANSLLWFAGVFQNIKILNIQIVTPTMITIFVYYMLLYLLFRYKKDKGLKLKMIIKKVFILYFVICFISKIVYFMDCNLKIYFVDVGQGDCTIIQTPEKHTIIIDGGGSEDGSSNDRVGNNIVIPFLLNKHMYKIDYMIISHFDSDHVGGLLTVLEKIKVKNVIISKQGMSCENYERFKRIVNKKKINVIVVEAGDRIVFENNLYLDILWPTKELIQDNILNNNSIVCKLYYKGFSMIFTGDIEKIAEKKMGEYYNNRQSNLKATILKAGHHGSMTSSTQELLDLIKPKYVMIGVGINNKFGHPNDEVIERFENIGAKIYRTDKYGEITIIVNKKGIVKIKKYVNE